MTHLLHKLFAFSEWFSRPFEWLAPGFLLALRFHVATVFFKSGLTKVADFPSTIALFENEYKVPLISPALAAYSGTGAELALPVLFALGLFSRPVALVFFVFNAIAVVSYPDISDAGIKDHLLWGTMMLVVLFVGAGRLSVDHVVKSSIGAKSEAV